MGNSKKEIDAYRVKCLKGNNGITTLLHHIQLFRQRLSDKSVKAYAAMPIGILGNKSLVCLIKVQGDSATRNENERICVCAVSFHHAQAPWVQSSNSKIHHYPK